LEAGFVPVERNQRAGIGQPSKSEPKTGWLVDFLEGCCDVAFLGVHFEIQETGFDRQEAQAPLGGDEFLDQPELDFTVGVKYRDIGVKELLIVFPGFVGEDDAFGGEACRMALKATLRWPSSDGFLARRAQCGVFGGVAAADRRGGAGAGLVVQSSAPYAGGGRRRPVADEHAVGQAGDL
jgi:hypothetical protein